MLARMTIVVKTEDNITEQSSAMFQQDNTTLDEFKCAVQDTFGVSFITNLEALFRKVENKIKARELETKLKPVLAESNTNEPIKDGLPASNLAPTVEPTTATT